MSQNLTKTQFTSNKISWKKSFAAGFSQDENGASVPWMTYPAIEFLKNKITKEHEIFEFGCGASTLFFARNAKRVVGLETNEIWLKIVREMLAKEVSENVEITLMADGLTNPLYENFAKNSGQKFDLIVIDSLKRFECAKHVIEALKGGGMVILDDSERKNYKKIFDFFAEKGFEKRDFFGIAPAQLRVKNTTVFFKD
jgi:predicted O-methyltransferase YrrM